MFEIMHNPNPVRREYALQAPGDVQRSRLVSELVERRAAELVAIGFKPLDVVALSFGRTCSSGYVLHV